MTSDQERAAFAKRLAAAMKSRHLDDRDVAGRIMVPTAYIERWRTGEGMPTDYSITRLAQALGVPFTALKTGHR